MEEHPPLEIKIRTRQQKSSAPALPAKGNGDWQMRIKIITGTSTVQKYFCAALCAEHEVVGIFHPMARSPVEKLRTAWRTLQPMNALSHLPMPLTWNKSASLRRAYAALIPDTVNNYARHCAKRAVHIDNVNAYDGISMVSRCEADVMICFGGPIYCKELISSCGMSLNYHTGLSPIYNGASAIYFAFASGHIDLCGGTLMTLSPKVDAGDVLSHYLPRIEATDDPATLFVKSVIGGVGLCNSFFQTAKPDGHFVTVPQGQPFFYHRARDWTVAHSHAIGRIIRQCEVARFSRPPAAVEYWRLSPPLARSLLRQNVVRWMMERCVGRSALDY